MGKLIPLKIIDRDWNRKNRFPNQKLDDNSADFLLSLFRIVQKLKREPMHIQRDTNENCTISPLSWLQLNNLKAKVSYCGSLFQTPGFNSYLFCVKIEPTTIQIYLRTYLFLLNASDEKISSYSEIAHSIEDDGAGIFCFPEINRNMTFYCREEFSIVSDVVVINEGKFKTNKEPSGSFGYDIYYSKFAFDENGFVKSLK
jgi:hypothetical protein